MLTESAFKYTYLYIYVKTQSQKDSETSIDFGTKTVRKHGDYTRVIALDRKMLENCGCNTDKTIKAKVELIKTDDDSFIKVSPFCVDETEAQTKEETEEK